MLLFKRIWELLSLTHYETSEFLCSRTGRPVFHNHQRGEMKSRSFETIAALIVKFKFIPAHWNPDEIRVKKWASENAAMMIGQSGEDPSKDFFFLISWPFSAALPFGFFGAEKRTAHAFYNKSAVHSRYCFKPV